MPDGDRRGGQGTLTRLTALVTQRRQVPATGRFDAQGQTRHRGGGVEIEQRHLEPECLPQPARARYQEVPGVWNQA